MGVVFKELAGSPLEMYGPEGMSARRVLVCAWGDRESLVAQLLGEGYEFGGSGRAQYPGKPDVVAMRVRCEPLADDVVPQVLNELTEGLNCYRGFAKITIDYELLVPTDREDLPAVEEGTLLTYRQAWDSDSMVLPSDAMVWASGTQQPVPDEAAPTIHVPIIEHRFIWRRVTSPPWESIRLVVGTVNVAPFLGASPGAVLFAGAKAELEFTRLDDLADPAMTWRIEYRFREKAVKTVDGSVVGWNHAFRSLPVDDPSWDELIDAKGNRPYGAGDFASLFVFG